MLRHPRVRMALANECARLGFIGRRSHFVERVFEAIRNFGKSPQYATEEERWRNALRDIQRYAKRALALTKRKTLRRGDYNRAIRELQAAQRRLVEADPITYALRLSFLGISGQHVRWATGQEPLPCLVCAEQPNLRVRCDCASWPAGKAWEFSNADQHRWINAPVKITEIDPLAYDPEARNGLLQLLAKTLSPKGAAWRRGRGRPRDDESEFMFEIFTAFEEEFDVLAHRSNTKAMALFQVVLDVFRYDHIALEYRLKTFEQARKRSERILSNAHNMAHWLDHLGRV